MRLIARAKFAALGIVLSAASQGATADVVAIVSSASSIRALSKSQIADIFMGRTSRLSNGVQLVPIDQPEGSSARDQFYANVAGKSAAQMKAYWSKIIFTGRGQPPKQVPTSADVKKRITEDLAAIGYVELNMVDASVKVLLMQ